MKCTKCGNEIKDDVKFCPNCGEEVKEEKKIKYCMKCGSELKPDSLFCSECGASIEDGQKKGTSAKSKKPVKKVLGVMGVLVVLVVVVGCFMINSDKAMYKAYIKFHDEYCDKHLNFKSKKERDWAPDCAAKIIMAPDNEKWLAIFDVISLSYDDEGNIIDESVKTKITLYRYSWGKVKKVSTLTKNVNWVDVFSLIDNELYLFTEDYDYGNVIDKIEKGNVKCVYRLNEKNKFETVKVKEETKTFDDDYYVYEDSEYYLESGMSLDRLMFLGNCLSSNSMDSINARMIILNNIAVAEENEFADVTKELSKYKIKDQVDLQIAYGKIFKDFGLLAEFYETEFYEEIFTDYSVVGTMKTEYGYYYVRTSGNVALAGLTEKGDLDKALKSADDRKVTGIEEGDYEDIPKNLKIPDNITYIGQYAFFRCENLQQVEIPDSVEKIGEYAFRECDNLQEVEIPDSVEKIGKDIFLDIKFPPIIIASEGSYAQQYAEENDLEWSAKKLSKEQLEERKLIGEALSEYDKWIENYRTSDKRYTGEAYHGVSLGYVNDDNIPECFMWKKYDDMWLGLTVLSYINGEVISQDIDIYDNYDECTYTPRSGMICGDCFHRYTGTEYKIYSLTDKFEVVTTAHSYWENEEYTVNGENYGSSEAVEEYIASLGLNDSFTEYDVYDAVYDAVYLAYGNMNKVN